MATGTPTACVPAPSLSSRLDAKLWFVLFGSSRMPTRFYACLPLPVPLWNMRRSGMILVLCRCDDNCAHHICTSHTSPDAYGAHNVLHNIHIFLLLYMVLLYMQGRLCACAKLQRVFV